MKIIKKSINYKKISNNEEENKMSYDEIFAALSKKAHLNAVEEEFAHVWDEAYIDKRINDLLNTKYKFGDKIVNFDEAKNYNPVLEKDLNYLKFEKNALLNHDYGKIGCCVAGDIFNNKPCALVCTY